MTPLDICIAIFGGSDGVARVAGVSASTVLRWGNSSKSPGAVPLDYFGPLLEAAARRGVSLSVDQLVFGDAGDRRQPKSEERATALERMVVYLSSERIKVAGSDPEGQARQRRNTP